MSLDPIYLDNNATTPVLPEVVEAMTACWRDGFANPGSRHLYGRRARQALETARESLASILGAHPDEVIFTSGGTESNNMAVLGLTATSSPLPSGGEGSGVRGPRASETHPHTLLSDARTPPHPSPLPKGERARQTIAFTRGEHPAVLEAARSLTSSGWRLHDMQVDSTGRLLAEQYASLPWNELRLVCVILAHNETGVIQNLAPLAAKCCEHHVPLHIDAVQAVGKIPVNFHELGATTLALGAHKFCGPRGIGALLLKRGVTLSRIAFGGHQEADRRPGTECVPLIVGMVRALELFQSERELRTRRLTELRDLLQAGLRRACPPVVVNGEAAPRLPNTLNIAFPGVDGEALLVALDLEGIACSLGSTCASGAAEPAPTLVAMGCPPEVYRSSVRFSLGVETTRDEIDRAITIIGRVVNRLRRME
ncbi:MAG: cysteine desulfurase [Planctomycetales bacterium]|nr:cysteine desulfurase [Planctomycetales bacterium]